VDEAGDRPVTLDIEFKPKAGRRGGFNTYELLSSWALTGLEAERSLSTLEYQ
jgi:hypothetical protein